MKTRLLILLLLISSYAFAQTTELLTGLTRPNGMVIKDNYLYYSETTLGTVSKIDISIVNASPIIVATGLSSPHGLLFIGNELYIADNNSVSKIDITSNNTTVTNVISGNYAGWSLGNAYSLSLHGNNLYIMGGAQNRIFKSDLSNPVSNLDLFANSNAQPFGSAVIGDNLYFSEFGGNTIRKIDLTQQTPTPVLFATGLNQPVHMQSIGSDLYVVNRVQGSISKIDTESPTPSPTLLVNGFNTPYGLAIKNQSIYVSEFFVGKIKEAISPTLSTSNFELNTNEISLNPNPTHSTLNIKSNQSIESAKVYTLLGQEVLKTNAKTIDVSNLPNGVYLIQISDLEGNQHVKRFIKE